MEIKKATKSLLKHLLSLGIILAWRLLNKLFEWIDKKFKDNL